MNDNLKYVDSGIQFNKVKNPDTLFTQGPLGIREKYNVNGDTVTNIDNSKHLINAVDIDWNGAAIDDNTEINTTGQLLAYIRSHSGSGNPSNPESQKFYDQRNYYRWYLQGVTPISPIPSGANSNGTQITPVAGDSNNAQPAYWSRNAINRPSNDAWILWMCTALVELSTEGIFQKIVSIFDPIQVSGVNGTPGEDLENREYIYKSFQTEQNFENGAGGQDNPVNWTNLSGFNTDDYTGPAYKRWNDTPEGISREYPYEYWSIRKRGSNGNWEAFSTPVIHSHWGHDGMDGDGVEYVFARTSIDVPPVVVATNEDQSADEYYPIVQIPAQYMTEGATISGTTESGLAINQARCTDDPMGVTISLRYEWVLKRKKVLNELTGNKEWQKYQAGTQMSKWGIYSVGDSVEIRNGQLYINGVATGITIEGSGGEGRGIPSVCFSNETDSVTATAYGPIINCNGTVYAWYNGKWNALGQSSGGGGIMHIAYADNITFNPQNPTEVIEVSGFTVDSSSVSKKWTGFCFNDETTDPGKNQGTNANRTTNTALLTSVNKYKWNFRDAVDGNGIEFIFCLTKTDTAPTIDQNSYISTLNHSNKNEEEFYPKVLFEGNYQSDNTNVLGRTTTDAGITWTDDPIQSVDSTWKYLWQATRKKTSQGWLNFGNIIQIDRYTTNGISVNTQTYYKWSTTVPQVPSTETEIISQNWILDGLWIANPDPTNPSYKLYMISRTLTNGVPGPWNGPAEVSPEGEDGIQYEFIYKRFTSIPSTWTTEGNNITHPGYISTGTVNGVSGSKTSDDFVPTGWTDNPQGVGTFNNIFYKYEYASIRTKSNGVWTDFIDPFPWSVYGEKGTDGDGIQYVFKGFPTEQNFSSGFSRETMVSGGWSDDPPQLNGTTIKYIYVAIIKYIDGAWEQNFSTPTLWSKWSDVGPRGSFQSRVFTRTPNTVDFSQATSDNTNNSNIDNTPNFELQYDGTTHIYNSYDYPIPPPTSFDGKNYAWSDGIPPGVGKIWSIVSTFNDDGTHSNWSTPQPEHDTDTLDIEFSDAQICPNPPAYILNNNNECPPSTSGTIIPRINNNYGSYGSRANNSGEDADWYDPSKDTVKGGNNTAIDWSSMIWRAERKIKNGIYDGGWVITKIVGETSNVEGGDGDIMSEPAPIILEQDTVKKDVNGRYCIDYGFGIQQVPGQTYYESLITGTPTKYTTIKSLSSITNPRITSTNCTVGSSIEGTNTLKLWIINISLDHDNYPSNGTFTVTFTSGRVEYQFNVRWYLNLVGNWRQTIEDGIEHSISEKIIYGLNDSQNAPNEVTTLTHIGEYIRGWAENTSQLSTSVDGITTEMSEIKQTSNKISLDILNSGKQLLKNTQFEQNTSDEYINWTYDGTHIIDDESYSNNEFTFNPNNTSGILNINNIQTFNSNLKQICQTINDIQKDTWYILSFNAKAQNLNILSNNLSINYTSQYQNSFKLYLLKDIEYKIKVTGYSSNSQSNQLKVKIDNEEISFDTTTSSQQTLTITTSSSGLFTLQTKGVGTITNININYTALRLILPSSNSSIQELLINGEYKTAARTIYIALNSTTSTKYTVVYKTPTTSQSSYNQLKICDLYNMPGTQINSLELYCDIKEGLSKTGIDIESGKITAKTDNFEIQNNSGTPTFSVDEDGNIVGSGNASFQGNISGSSITAGTIISDSIVIPSNFYHKVCVCGGYELYSTNEFQCLENIREFEVGKIYTQEELNNIIGQDVESDLYKWYYGGGSYSNAGRDLYFKKCSGNADIIQYGNYNQTVNTEYDQDYNKYALLLPNPSGCPGKIIELNSYTSGSAQWFDISCVSIDNHLPYFSKSIGFSQGNLTSEGAGQYQDYIRCYYENMYRFMSIQISGEYVWWYTEIIGNKKLRRLMNLCGITDQQYY